MKTVDVHAGKDGMVTVTTAVCGSGQTVRISPQEAADLSGALLAVAEEARANERRCGTCGNELNRGWCSWRPTNGISVPPWVITGHVTYSDLGHNCPAWTKREGGQAT